jgi:hypothetical protein
MSKESRKKLASLSFTEKVRILEKLRDRSLALAESRKKLEAKKQAEAEHPGTLERESC